MSEHQYKPPLELLKLSDHARLKIILLTCKCQDLHGVHRPVSMKYADGYRLDLYPTQVQACAISSKYIGAHYHLYTHDEVAEYLLRTRPV